MSINIPPYRRDNQAGLEGEPAGTTPERFEAAVAAMQGLLAGNSSTGWDPEELAASSVRAADALLEELAK